MKLSEKERAIITDLLGYQRDFLRSVIVEIDNRTIWSFNELGLSPEQPDIENRASLCEELAEIETILVKLES